MYLQINLQNRFPPIKPRISTAGKHAITPEVKLVLTYDFARPKEDRTVTLPVGMEIGAKAAVHLTNAVKVSLSYDGAFKEHYQDHTGLLNVKLEF